MSNADLINYDDSDAIEFITKYLAQNGVDVVAEDDIQYILDLVCEYYEKCNLLSDPNAEDATVAENEMLEYIQKLIAKEKVISIDEDTLQWVLDGEYEYGVSIGIYE